jgi:tetratricopeptide (TPR) repeat protein
MDAKAIAKLKDLARIHEQREDWEDAISAYQQVLRAADEDQQVGELPLYNRVGDLYLRAGRPNDAVRYYEQAADRYGEAGLFNNAIALCNKALRYAPHRLDLLRKLGRFSASQGFLSEARRWFLEYAERAMHKGETDDAFRALDDFADISDDPEVRELLARKMYAHGRLDDALREYQRAYAMRLRDGGAEAAESLKTEVLQRYPQLQDLSPAEPASRHARHAMSEALPELREGAESEQSATEPPPAPAGMPGSDAAHAQASDDANRELLAGFERTSLADEEAEEDDPEAVEPLPSLDSGAHDDGFPFARPGAQAASAPPLPGLDDRPANAKGSPPEAPAGDYVDLSDMLGFNEEQKKETRFFVQETNPTGDEDRDFAELLAQFKQKLAESIAHDDIGSHYDLGLAFKEMGLVDEAISEFQIALRAGDDRLKIFEELGQCFLLKKQYNIAVKVLSRAMQLDPDDESELIGVYYHLGRAFEELGQRDKALDAYERVLGLDLNFQDVAQRMAGL